MALHAEGERLDAAQGQPAVERPGDGAGGILVEADRLQQLARADDGAADDVGMAAEVLGRAVHDDVRAQAQRLLQVRRGERVVHGQQGAGFAAELRDGGDIQDLQERIGRRLDPHQLGPGCNDSDKTGGSGVFCIPGH